VVFRSLKSIGCNSLFSIFDSKAGYLLAPFESPKRLLKSSVTLAGSPLGVVAGGSSQEKSLKSNSPFLGCVQKAQQVLIGALVLIQVKS